MVGAPVAVNAGNLSGDTVNMGTPQNPKGTGIDDDNDPDDITTQGGGGQQALTHNYEVDATFVCNGRDGCS